MVEDGSRAGFYFGCIGGYLNLIAMAALIVKVIYISLGSLEQTKPDYTTYFIYIGIMLYIGILGVWMLSSAFAMKYAYSLYKGARVCLILGFLSLNVFAIFGGIFGLSDFKGIAVGLVRKRVAKDELKLNPDF